MKFNYNLKKISSIGLGGRARYFFDVKDEKDLFNVIEFSNYKNLEIVFIGSSSNCVFSDGLLNIILVRSKFNNIFINDNLVKVGSGVIFSKISKILTNYGLSGLEHGMSIPGTIGGAVVMNASVCGMDTWTHLDKVDCVTLDLKKITLKKEELYYGYRDSFFKNNNLFITDIYFSLEKRSIDYCIDNQNKIFEYKKEKQPLKERSAGCVFKNINEKSVGKLIDEAGLKGYTLNGIKISEKHANFIVNISKESKSEDFIKVVKIIKSKIKNKYDLDLELEVIPIGWSI